MVRASIALAGLCLAASVSAAQPPQPQTPPRDNAQSAQPPATAIIRGHVVAAENGQPLRKAQVRIFSPELRENRMATTDGDGKYEFKEVKAGRYTVNASKGSYVGLAYGQTRAFEQGKPLEIAAGQLVEKVDFALPRGAIITGRVIDEFGEPLPDAMVSVQRYQNVGGQKRLVPAGRTSMTNDIGEFRLFAIPPGQYYVQASLRSNMGMADSDDRSGYAPTYFPGTANMAEAQKVTVRLGQVISDMNMALLPMRTARVTGTAVDSRGRPLSGAVMALPKNDSVMFMFGPPAQIKPDGSFTISGLTPGDYVLQNNGPQGSEYASTDVTINGDDVNGVQLVSAPPLIVSGRIVVDPAAAQALRVSTLQIMIQPAQIGPMFGFTGPTPVNDDLTFEAKGRPGKMRVAMANPMPGWAIRSVLYRGVDVTDSLELRAGESITDVEVELTNRLTDISGLVTTAKGEGVKDYTVIVFPQDRDKWTVSRYLRLTRPDQDGRYKVNGLPPGEYHVIALDYVDSTEWSDPEFLDLVRAKASSIRIGEGEAKSIDLRIMTGS
ncbi:MAG TPA: carboxypeptidase-like regulatory domain-containing protein [Vicinamibacterales bacterium]|nr:carboxypeptidase-like regulatory domain-containing protein [Vicinamibacterales bacterium]